MYHMVEARAREEARGQTRGTVECSKFVRLILVSASQGGSTKLKEMAGNETMDAKSLR